MGNGYESEVVIGYFHYTYGIYARSCNYWFEDKDHTVIYSSRNCGEKVYSEDE